MSKDTGGPAFPTENARQTGHTSYHYEGMSLRDYFAASAMQGFAANAQHAHMLSAELYAKAAYRWADAMLEVRGL